MRFNVLALALAGGITWAFCLLCLGLVAWLFDWGNAMVAVLGSLYIGYASTPVGAIIGTVWAFADGFIGLAIFTLIYNWLVPSARTP